MRAVLIATERDHPLFIATERDAVIATERDLHRNAVAPLCSCRLYTDETRQRFHSVQG